MPDYNFKNNLKSTLQAKLWSDGTVIYCNHVVESEDADTRRNAWPAFPFTLTLVDTANDNIEVIKCTSLAGNFNNYIAFACDRAQENTTAQTFETATTNVEHRLTSGALNSIVNAITTAIADINATNAGKANLDMDNLTQSGTTSIAHNAMPSTRSVNVSVPASMGTFVAIGDGFLTFTGAATAQGGILAISAGGVVSQSAMALSSGNSLGCSAPVSKNSTVTVFYTAVNTLSITFRYANGAR